MMGLVIGNTSFLFAGIHQALGEPALHQKDDESGRRHHKKGSGHGDVPGRLGIGDRDRPWSLRHYLEGADDLVLVLRLVEVGDQLLDGIAELAGDRIPPLDLDAVGRGPTRRADQQRTGGEKAGSDFTYVEAMFRIPRYSGLSHDPPCFGSGHLHQSGLAMAGMG
ncbi:hypothetical protein [Neorhizobium galegae]|uniref:hypothetical protein n=1 Tax=Neorhizobium galegae TaxID=399 RepID=UPI0020361533|nr:hypothetical protein [Neorhizobium galegae]MCM2499392.1 hypothetical protein [Neorhizobium galegae]MCQ1773959.1 hypothetical protein [Neorhizobium galegae]MCQ1776609.1 hypothetical protein [Neorhizobium galegae]MCQ1793927.1 hypothetical protein [Neorhizobium galegae]